MSFGISSLSASSLAGYASQTLQPSPFRQFANLNLTQTQRTEIQNILSNAQSSGLSGTQVQKQISAILNPQQQQTLQADLQAQQSTLAGRHHGHHHRTSSTSTDGSSSALGLSDGSSSSNGISALLNSISADTSLTASNNQASGSASANDAFETSIQNQLALGEYISNTQLQNTLAE